MQRRGEDDTGEGASWLVFRHVATEGLGLVQNVLRDFGVQHRYLDLPRGDPLPKDLRGVGGLIVLGGPMAVYEMDQHPFLRAEAGFIERAMAAGRPVLGVCLGAQLIAHVLGARVFAGERREVGWAPITLTADGRDDALFMGATPQLTVFHFHGDTYELPPDGHNLASSPLYEQQAFRVGELVYGFQFHLEFTETIIQKLTAEPESRRYIEEAGVDAGRLAAESPAFVRALAEPAHRILSEYFRLCGL